MERSRKIAVLAAVNVSVYSMIYMKGTFYNIMQSALRLSHEQLGTALSLYGMVALISYPLGGWIADSFSSRKMVVLSMGGTIVLGLALASLPSYSWLLLIFVWRFFNSDLLSGVHAAGQVAGHSGGRGEDLWCLLEFDLCFKCTGVCPGYSAGALFPRKLCRCLPGADLYDPADRGSGPGVFHEVF